jgi:hypothetical protein
MKPMVLEVVDEIIICMKVVVPTFSFGFQCINNPGERDSRNVTNDSEGKNERRAKRGETIFAAAITTPKNQASEPEQSSAEKEHRRPHGIVMCLRASHQIVLVGFQSASISTNKEGVGDRQEKHQNNGEPTAGMFPIRITEKALEDLGDVSASLISLCRRGLGTLDI